MRRDIETLNSNSENCCFCRTALWFNSSPANSSKQNTLNFSYLTLITVQLVCVKCDSTEMQCQVNMTSSRVKRICYLSADLLIKRNSYLINQSSSMTKGICIKKHVPLPGWKVMTTSRRRAGLKRQQMEPIDWQGRSEISTGGVYYSYWALCIVSSFPFPRQSSSWKAHEVLLRAQKACWPKLHRLS